MACPVLSFAVLATQLILPVTQLLWRDNIHMASTTEYSFKGTTIHCFDTRSVLAHLPCSMPFGQEGTRAKALPV